MWTLNGIRIFTTDFDDDFQQIIARLQPLGGGTVHHIFGYESVVSHLTFYIVGDTDLLSLRTLTRTGSSYTLISDQGSYGDFLVKGIKAKRINSICQTLRPDLDEDSPVYLCDAEVYLDE